MNSAGLEEIKQAAEERKASLRRDKGAEYTQGDVDVLANFKKGGLDLRIPAMQVWWIYYKKHQDAILSFIIHGQEFSTEPIEGRIDDAQVYLDLLRGLVAEHKAAAAIVPKEEVPF